jgi:hypothetical protein
MNKRKIVDNFLAKMFIVVTMIFMGSSFASQKKEVDHIKNKKEKRLSARKNTQYQNKTNEDEIDRLLRLLPDKRSNYLYKDRG